MLMYLKRIFDDLAYGEFSNMALSKSPNGSIKQEDYPKVVSYINQALVDIFTRFLLKKKEFKLHQREDRSLYYIREDNIGDPNIGDPNIYIDGTEPDCIDGDIIKPIEAYDSLGEEVRINNGAYPDDIFTLEFDVFKIAPRDPLEVFSIVYQAAHEDIVIEKGFDPATYEIYIPRYLKTALLANLTARLYRGKTGKVAEGQQNLANTYLYRYEQEMSRIEDLGLTQEVIEDNENFDNGGFP